MSDSTELELAVKGLLDTVTALNPDRDLVVILRRYDRPQASFGIHLLSLNVGRRGGREPLISHRVGGLFRQEPVEAFLSNVIVYPADWLREWDDDDDLTPCGTAHKVMDEWIWEYIRDQVIPMEWKSDEHWEQRKPFIRIYEIFDATLRGSLVDSPADYVDAVEMVVDDFREHLLAGLDAAAEVA